MRRFFPLLLLVMLVLAGCLPKAQLTPTNTPTSSIRPTQTVALIVPQVSPIPLDTGCTAVTREPTPGPTAESVVPPVSDTDWIKGAADAKVTIIEYSDFQ